MQITNNIQIDVRQIFKMVQMFKNDDFSRRKRNFCTLLIFNNDEV